MISINTNASAGIKNIKEKIALLSNPEVVKEQLLRLAALNSLSEVKTRIHTEGLDATGNPIGSYSSGYMAVRTGQFKSNGKVSKGKKKGENKSKGVFTKGKNKGGQRPNYNRTNDKKVIISLTTQMESDFSVFATERGYGLGYKNKDNFDKVAFVEKTYKKKIFALTEEEKEKVKDQAVAFVNHILNG